MIREINAADITNAVSQLFIDANLFIAPDIKKSFEKALDNEVNALSRDVLEKLLENARIAGEERIPICQDTGMAVVFCEIGQDAHIIGGDLTDAINAGVRKGYGEGFLRKSVVADPINRVNTKDNTPAVIHCQIVPGDKLKITAVPKGFGSENMSRLQMLKPSAGIDGVKAFVLDTVRQAGPNPCPPIVVGVGVGGTLEKCAILAKEALLREIGAENPDAYWNGVEAELLESVNALGIGPGGFGGRVTAMAVHIKPFATHIAGLPVAVNIGCHVTRHKHICL